MPAPSDKTSEDVVETTEDSNPEVDEASLESEAEKSAPTELPILTKVCPKCSTQTDAAGSFCPNCGASYSGSSKKLNISKKAMLISAAVTLLVAAALVVVLSVAESNREAEAERIAVEATAAASRSAAAVASASAAAAAAQAAEDEIEKGLRKVMITSLEESVLKDAKKREADGRLTGPFTRASCTPLGGGSVDDLTAKTGTLECIAINKKDEDGSESGYVFSATINWDKGEYQWHLGR